MRLLSFSTCDLHRWQIEVNIPPKDFCVSGNRKTVVTRSELHRTCAVSCCVIIENVRIVLFYLSLLFLKSHYGIAKGSRYFRKVIQKDRTV